jgi:hypothetical protein
MPANPPSAETSGPATPSETGGRLFRQRLFNWAASASALYLALLIALWAFLPWGGVEFGSANQPVALSFYTPYLAVTWWSNYGLYKIAGPSGMGILDKRFDVVLLRGERRRHEPDPKRVWRSTLEINLILPAIPCVILALRWASVTADRLERQRRAKRSHLCPACSYDLRGSPGPTCPECGAARTSSSAG